MSGSMNKVILIGNLGRDPEVRTFANGGKVCNLTLATSESWKDRNTGERREKTEWHRIAIFAEGLIKIVEQYCTKGTKIVVQGALETRKWQDQSGSDRYTTEVVLRPFTSTLTMLSKGSQGGDGSRDERYMKGQDQQGSGNVLDEGGGSGGSSGFDDEIPF